MNAYTGKKASIQGLLYKVCKIRRKNAVLLQCGIVRDGEIWIIWQIKARLEAQFLDPRMLIHKYLTDWY